MTYRKGRNRLILPAEKRRTQSQNRVGNTLVRETESEAELFIRALSEIFITAEFEKIWICSFEKLFSSNITHVCSNFQNFQLSQHRETWAGFVYSEMVVRRYRLLISGTVLLTGQPNPSRTNGGTPAAQHRNIRGIELDEAIYGHLSPRSFNGTFISGTEPSFILISILIDEPSTNLIETYINVLSGDYRGRNRSFSSPSHWKGTREYTHNNSKF